MHNVWHLLLASPALWSSLLTVAGCVSPPEYALDTAMPEPDETLQDTATVWDARPPHEVGLQATFIARCALLASPIQMTWTLVDADAHRWTLDDARTDVGTPASWIPPECHIRLGSNGELDWLEDGHITYDVIHEATPSLRAGAWLGVVHLEQVELSAACREVYAEHGASLPALELVRVSVP